MNINSLISFRALKYFALFAAMSFLACEDDSLPGEGEIADITPPNSAFAVANSSTSSLIKVFLNTSLSATGGTWSFPEGSGQFVSECTARGTTGCSDDISLATDERVYYKFNDFGTYTVGITASDDLGVVADLSTTDIVVESTNAPAPTVTFEFSKPEEAENAQRVLTNNSVNTAGDITWSVTNDEGDSLEISDILVKDDGLDGNLLTLFQGQKEGDDSILVDFITAGDYTVTLTASNFDGVVGSDTVVITVDPKPVPEPEFTASASSDYSFYTLTNTTPDTDRVIWSLPAGATFANGSTETDQSIDVAFDSSAVYDITLKVISVDLDENEQPFDLEGEAIIPVTVVGSLSEIPTPVIYRGGFEPGVVTNVDGTGTFRNDLGKEWWPADGVSNRVYLGDTINAAGETVADPNQTIIDTGLENESWFGPSSGFNRLNITGSARTGARAASFDPTRPTRIAVQTIDVTPGVDYKVSFFVNNVSNIAGNGLKVYILNADVANETEANLIDNRVAGMITQNPDTLYVEESLEFNSGDNTQVKLYFYPADPTAGTFFLDDVSIAID